MRSGFVTLLGRPNVGKSTLVNRILGEKVSIVSDKPQTTRNEIRGVLDRPDVQIVFVDTPGLHKPKNALGQHLNDTARGAGDGADVVCLVCDAAAPIGRGDAYIAQQIKGPAVVVLNKIDRVDPGRIAAQLTRASELPLQCGLDQTEFVPTSARTGEGVDVLIEVIEQLLPEGPRFYPEGIVVDLPEAFRVAEAVREELLSRMREELPHSIATRVTEWEWPRIRCEIVVERESQKGIVIGAGGRVLKEVGTQVRSQLPPGAFLELAVVVQRDWQRRPGALERLGYGGRPL